MMMKYILLNLFILGSALASTAQLVPGLNGKLNREVASPPSFTAQWNLQAELYFPILDCVGSAHGSLGLRTDYRDHLAKVQRDIGFKHIRGHGLMNDDMSTYLNGKANLINLFSIFDFYLSVGLKPIFEISFMPALLAFDKTRTVMHYQGITSTFAADKAQEWGQLITDMFTGLEARYGIDEVRSWRIEVSQNYIKK